MNTHVLLTVNNYIIGIFDKSCFNREVGTIIRSLNCCPSEAELHDMLAEVHFFLQSLKRIIKNINYIVQSGYDEVDKVESLYL